MDELAFMKCLSQGYLKISYFTQCLFKNRRAKAEKEAKRRKKTKTTQTV